MFEQDLDRIEHALLDALPPRVTLHALESADLPLPEGVAAQLQATLGEAVSAEVARLQSTFGFDLGQTEAVTALGELSATLARHATLSVDAIRDAIGTTFRYLSRPHDTLTEALYSDGEVQQQGTLLRRLKGFADYPYLLTALTRHLRGQQPETTVSRNTFRKVIRRIDEKLFSGRPESLAALSEPLVAFWRTGLPHTDEPVRLPSSLLSEFYGDRGFNGVRDKIVHHGGQGDEMLSLGDLADLIADEPDLTALDSLLASDEIHALVPGPITRRARPTPPPVAAPPAPAPQPESTPAPEPEPTPIWSVVPPTETVEPAPVEIVADAPLVEPVEVAPPMSAAPVSATEQTVKAPMGSVVSSPVEAIADEAPKPLRRRVFPVEPESDDDDEPFVPRPSDSPVAPVVDADVPLWNRVAEQPAPAPPSEPTVPDADEDEVPLWQRLQQGEAPSAPIVSAAEAKLPDVDSLVDEPLRKRVIKRIFGRDEGAYYLTVAALNRFDSWQEAEAYLDRSVYTRFGVSPYADEARALSNAVMSRYYPA